VEQGWWQWVAVTVSESGGGDGGKEVMGVGDGGGEVVWAMERQRLKMVLRA
jgi:hypothetical protein